MSESTSHVSAEAGDAFLDAEQTEALYLLAR